MKPWAWLGIVVAMLGAAVGLGKLMYDNGRYSMIERAIRAETALLDIHRESKAALEQEKEKNEKLQADTKALVETIRKDAAADVARADARRRATVSRLLDSAACLREPSGGSATAGTGTAAGGADAAAAGTGVVPRSRADDLSDVAERAEGLGRQVTGLQALVRQYHAACSGRNDGNTR